MTVTTERLGRVLVIRMERVAKRNAIDGAMTEALDAALNVLDDDPELWAGVLTGGTEVFSAGTDMAAGSGTPTERGGIYGIIGRQRRRPLVAAVEKIAFGGGFEIALSCDLIVAGADARFGLPEVKRGLIPTSAGLFRAPRALPLNLAKELILTGEPIGADRLYQLGVVNRVVPPGTALEEALTLAGQMVANSPVAVSQALAAVDRIAAAGVTDDAGWSVTREAAKVIIASEDRKEGIAAFFERRAPNWPGR
jgi:enoyl-CoA hydratase/carnithine racemase